MIFLLFEGSIEEEVLKAIDTNSYAFPHTYIKRAH